MKYTTRDHGSGAVRLLDSTLGGGAATAGADDEAEAEDIKDAKAPDFSSSFVDLSVDSSLTGITVVKT